MLSKLTGVLVAALLAYAGAAPAANTQSCFLLYEIGVGQVRRDPADACRTRMTPASTFKIPHALAALDAGVIAGPDERMPYVAGTAQWPESARRDHTLATAIRHSVVWYLQRTAERLGPAREAAYLKKFSFGNMDATSGLTTFWLAGSLRISPEEQQAFWLKLYQDQLPVSPRAMSLVKTMLIQPEGVVVNAAGEQPFGKPWPAGTTVSAKTGSATVGSSQAVRWLVGHVTRGSRAFVFVSCVIGGTDLQANAAIDLAARSLRGAGVL